MSIRDEEAKIGRKSMDKSCRLYGNFHAGNHVMIAGRRAYIAVYYSWLPRAWDGALNEVKSAGSPGEPQPTIKSTFKVGGWNYRQANARC